MTVVITALGAAVLLCSAALHALIFSTFLHSGGLVAFACMTLIARCSWRLSVINAAGWLALATVAGHGWWSGAADCGCFPGLQVPAWATVTFDMVQSGAWARWAYTCRRTQPAVSWSRALVRAVLACTMAVLATWAVVTLRKADPVGSWPTPLDHGAWRVIALREGCSHCERALSWIVPMANADPRTMALVSLSGDAAWLRQRGVEPSVPVLERPSPWAPAPQGWLVRDGAVVGQFPIPDGIDDTAPAEESP